MSSESQRESATTRTKSERRYWRRTDSPKPWWPWGFIPVAGLALLFLFGTLFTAPRIEAEVREQVAGRFDNAGVKVSDVASDGQGVSLHARALPKEKIYLQALAESTQCDTWAGQMTCPTSVAVIVDSNEPAPALPVRRPHPFTVSKSEDTVTLTGEVPNLEEHGRILGVAGQHFDIVRDELTVSNEAARDNDARAADVTLALASNLTSGEATWSGKALSVSGIASANLLAATRKQFDAFESGSASGEFDVRVVNAAHNCNKKFDEMLSNASVRFQTGSATIDAGNEDLLARLADLAQSCPGRLVVEGHTDSRGDAEMNKALSLARASAVRDALTRLGVDADRVEVTGLGATQPIADNTMPDGRARNRRIAITIKETN